MEPFRVKDCTIILETTGKEAFSLRELRDRIWDVDIDSIYHHFHETLLRPSFDDPEYHNDFAHWVSAELRDQALAEKLGMINPYRYKSTEDLRQTLLDIVEDRISELDTRLLAPTGHQFVFLKACTVIFDTETVFTTPDELARGIKDLTLESIYYHFVEARRRDPVMVDDFSHWLKQYQGKESADVCGTISEIDIGFLSLREMKNRLIAALEPECATS